MKNDKRRLTKIIAFLLLVCICFMNVDITQAQAATKYKVTLDGKTVSVPVVSKNGTYYFQLTKILKATGWSCEITKYTYVNSQFVVMKKGDKRCSFFDDDKDISVYCDYNSKYYDTWGTTLDKKMFISKGNLYVPLKFVKDILRLDVNIKSNTITLRTIKDHTLLVYIIASDLESDIGPWNPEGAATADLKELMEVGSTSRVNVAVQTGGTSKWNNNFIKGNSVQRWYVQKGKMKQIADLGKKNMGDPKDLQSFIEWGIKTYPAESYTLVLWDHGGGPLFGYGYDEISGDHLTMNELETALSKANKNTKKKLANIVFDACIMSSIEIADIVSPYASNMVASQISLPAHGLDYSAIVPLLEKNLIPESSRFAANLVDQFEDYATKMGTMDDMQLSSIDLVQFQKFMKKFNTFIGKINKDMDSDSLLVYDLAIARADEFDFKDEDITGDGNDLTNLYDLLWRISYQNSDYKNEVEELRSLYDAFVTNNITGDNVISLDGMSIYMPLLQFGCPTYEQDYLSLYKDIGFSKEYTSFVEKYYKKIMLDEYNIDITTNVTTGTFDRYYKASDALKLEISADSYNKIESIDSVTEIYNDELGKYIINASYPSFFFREDAKVSENSLAFTLNGNYITMLFDGNISIDIKLFTVPILLNGEQAELYVVEEGYKEFYIIGVQVINENESGMASKRNIELKSTDTIEPLFLARGDNGFELVRSNNSFTLDNGTIKLLEISELKEKMELYYNINLFNQTSIETNHVSLDSTNN